MAKEPREVRHYILVACEKALPSGASEELLAVAMSGIDLEVAPNELQVHLQYLNEKGYVERETLHDKATRIQRKMVKLTAKGLDLLEGNLPKDPGIGLVEYDD